MTDEIDRLHQHAPSVDLQITDDGLLIGPGVVQCPSARSQALLASETHILGIVWHYTDTRSCGALNLAKRIVAYPSASERSASWHLCIDRAGNAVQSVSARRGSWHAGGAQAARFAAAPVLIGGHRRWMLQPATSHSLPGANSLFFGIELENVGEVRFVAGEWLGWPFKKGTQYGEPIVVPADEVFGPPSSAHHVYTDAQISMAERVTQALVHKYALIRENCAWSHQMIDPENRTDPGPLWMGGSALPAILDHVFGT